MLLMSEEKKSEFEVLFMAKPIYYPHDQKSDMQISVRNVCRHNLQPSDNP